MKFMTYVTRFAKMKHILSILVENIQRRKKSLKIPKGYSESVYRRRTDNTMTKRKKYKRTNNDQQNIHIKLKIEKHEPH
jgi:hypothetical protein